MKTISHHALVGFLVYGLSGCASYAPAYLPPEILVIEEGADSGQVTDQDRTSLSDKVRIVEVGHEVKITTKDGETHTGEVLRLSSEVIVLGKVCNYGVCETLIEVSDIVELKSRYASQVALASGAVVGVVTGFIAVLTALLVASGGFGSN